MYSKIILTWFAVFIIVGEAFASPGSLKIGNDTTICAGNCLTLRANIIGKYLWSTGDTTASIKVCPANSMMVSLKVVSGIKVYTDAINITVDKHGIWPGDADDNGTVSGRDVLNIGLAYGNTGPARANTTTNWDAQHADNWKKTFKGGINYKYADCNGDGKINSDDLAAIGSNWSESHSKTEDTSTVSGNPQLYLVTTADSFYPGENVNFQIYLGKVTNPAVNVYGVDFSYGFTPGSIQLGSMSLTVNQSNCWLYGTDGPTAVMSFLEADYGSDIASVAITRTVQPGLTGYGEIGVLSISIDDNVAGKQAGPSPLTYGFTEEEAVGGDESDIPLSAVNKTVYVENKTLGIKAAIHEGDAISIYPNPVQGNALNIDLKNIKADQISIVDMVGNTVYNVVTPTTGLNQLQLPNLNTGMYIVQVSTQQGMIMRKININR